MSLRRLARKLRLRFRRPPASARDLLPDYGEYLRLQRERFLSYESDVPRWVEGQRRFLEAALAGLPPDARILDCACGDGAGLAELGRAGFRDTLGVELSPEKAQRARTRGFRVEELDMHDLSRLEGGAFDAIVSSHTLEHAYDPGEALAQLRRLLKPGGRLHVVLPYPDPGARNELAHVAKYALGTDQDDGGARATQFFTERGFELISRRFDDFREPELWLSLEKRGE